MTIGQRIKAARKKAGMTQKELAKKLDIPYQSIGQWENDQRNPKIETLQRISHALGVHIFDLAGIGDELNRYSYEITDVRSRSGDTPVSEEEKQRFATKISGMSVQDLYDELSEEDRLEFWRIASEAKDTAAGAKKEKSSPYSSEALRLARDYDEKLDNWGRKQVRSTADIEIARCEDESRFLEETAPAAEEEPKIIPLYWAPAAAGYASPIFGSDFDYYTLTPEDPQGAVFAIRVQGDSMEPHFPDGSIAFCDKTPLADGDIGVFCLDGDSFIKQYHFDKMMGITYLFSLNRDRADADKLLARTGGQTLTCFGRVVTKRRFPVPGEEKGYGRW